MVANKNFILLAPFGNHMHEGFTMRKERGCIQITSNGPVVKEELSNASSILIFCEAAAFHYKNRATVDSFCYNVS